MQANILVNSQIDINAHTLLPDPVTDHFSVNPEFGLSSAQAQERLLHDGPNQLAEVLRRSAWLVLLAQFKGLMIIILIGESMPVGKQADVLALIDAPLGDRFNMSYMNTLLTRGRAELVVTATGANTEMGQLSQELATTDDVPTPLQIQLNQLAKRLGIIALSMVALLSLLQYCAV